MKYPSVRGPRPNGVLITRSMLPPRIISPTLSGPSLTLATRSTGMPARCSTPAVPPVATSRNPRSASRFAGKTIARLSRLATLTKTVPAVGSAWPGRDHRLGERHARVGVDAHDLAGRLHLRARARCRRRGSGRTAAPPPSRSCTRGAGSGADRPAARRRRRGRRGVRPVSTNVAMRASETPITFETNGTVRDARGFASITQMRSSFTASCRFSSPTTPSRRASRRVMSSIVSSSSSD